MHPHEDPMLAATVARIECEMQIESISHRMEELVVDGREQTDQYVQARDKRRHLMRELLQLRLNEAALAHKGRA